jgi:hypothetical protein
VTLPYWLDVQEGEPFVRDGATWRIDRIIVYPPSLPSFMLNGCILYRSGQPAITLHGIICKRGAHALWLLRENGLLHLLAQARKEERRAA